ncbi:conserved hypothetical protein [uncultured Pleomorphomonas sp.]|uniref:Bbp19-like phage domain-containing protein n=1 Tax=uncultured Pleomorphomonas sp. TaxID=442121 RepID=A0A212LQ82_9HYPH|nr:hypothetical protein [uncultured Pleomorphomonas sp.]SCM79641.1 conserved hypothetical protein [uncultured Pleomorphomonas sp.]
MLDEFEAREARDAEARARAAQEEADLIDAFRLTMETAEGKRVMFWLLGRAGLYANAFDAGSEAAERYRLGRQSIGLEILQKLDLVDARLYPRLLLERGEEKELTRAAREAGARTTEDGDDQYA